jgi:hypothetical protein
LNREETLMSNTPNPFPRDPEQLYLIPPDEVPPWFEVEGKGAAITHVPQHGKRVTMVISGIVEQFEVKRDKDLGMNVVVYQFKADRSLVLDPGTVVEATNARMLEQLEEFITVEDFDVHEVASFPDGVDPDTGEVLKPDDGGDSGGQGG